MKKLALLRDWTKVLFVLSLLPLILLPGFVLVYLLFPNFIPVTFTAFGSKGFHAGKFITFAIIVTGYGFFVYALYLFRKVLALFAKRQIFNDEVIKYFSQIGKLIYYGLLLIGVPYNVYLIITCKELSLDSDQLLKVIFTFSLGLFFTVLSEIFKKAKELKEENELTI